MHILFNLKRLSVSSPRYSHSDGTCNFLPFFSVFFILLFNDLFSLPAFSFFSVNLFFLPPVIYLLFLPSFALLLFFSDFLPAALFLLSAVALFFHLLPELFLTGVPLMFNFLTLFKSIFSLDILISILYKL